jgi:hypothetical protein
MCRFAAALALLLAVAWIHPAAAQFEFISSDSFVAAGDAEGPQGHDSDTGLGNSAASTSHSNDFGSASAVARNNRADFLYIGQTSSTPQDGGYSAPWVTRGSAGITYPTAHVSYETALMGADVPGIKMSVVLSWSVTGSGFYNFGVNNAGASWSSVGGALDNTLHLGLGSSGSKKVNVSVPFESTEADPENNGFTIGYFPMILSIGGGADSGSQSNGTFSTSSVYLSMRVYGYTVVGDTSYGEDNVEVSDVGEEIHDVELDDGSVILDPVIAGPTFELADFDVDGDVDGSDFLTWQQNLGTTAGALRTAGNSNVGDDGDVDAEDLAVWRAQFGLDGNAISSTTAASVPEPTASHLILALVASFAVLHRRF